MRLFVNEVFAKQFVNEVFATAFYRNLAPSHPVYKVFTIFKKFFSDHILAFTPTFESNDFNQ